MDKKKALRVYKRDLIRVLTIAEKVKPRLQAIFQQNPHLYDTLSRHTALMGMIANFLDRMIAHSRSIILLAEKNSMDCILIARTMVEGTAQLRYVREAKNRKDLAVKWRDFSYQKEKKHYWHHPKTPTELLRELSENIHDLTPFAKDKTRLLQFNRYFGAYHHWNFTLPMNKRKDVPISMMYAFFCLRYVLESTNLIFGLKIDLSGLYPRGYSSPTS